MENKNVYFFKNTFSSSYNFYSASLLQVYNDSINRSGKSSWLIYNKSQQKEVDSAGFIFGKEFIVSDYEITRLNKSFIDPATRKEILNDLIMTEIIGKRKD
jgi:hypothetical protein